jgi:hypothetical protein
MCACWHGGIAGRRRLSRHLLRMCLVLFVAAGSVFGARAQLFPVIMQKTGMLVFLTFLPLALIIFWVVRLRYRGTTAGMISIPRRIAIYAAAPNVGREIPYVK